MAFFTSKRKLRPVENDGTGELNTIPYLDILMNLILFMLLSVSGLATFGVINASVADAAPGTATTSTDPPTVVVSARGFRIGASEPIPLRADGTWDFAALTAQLAERKRAFPAETKIVLTPDATVPFEVLVSTMDAVRETPAHEP